MSNLIVINEIDYRIAFHNNSMNKYELYQYYLHWMYDVVSANILRKRFDGGHFLR